MLKKTKLALIAALSMSLAQPTYAFDLKKFFGFGDKEEPQETTSAQENTSIESLAKQFLTNPSTEKNTLSSVLNSPLVQSVTNNLDVSGTQAASGTAALLAMATSQLNAKDSLELSNLIPQLGNITDIIPANLTDKLSSISSVQSLFKGLGMDASMISQFVPVIIETLTGLGASNNLLGQLNSVWKTA